MILLSSIQLFFMETGQATTHRRDIISNAVRKIGTLVTAGGFLEWGECFVCWNRGGGRGRKNQSWKREVNIGVLPVMKTHLWSFVLQLTWPNLTYFIIEISKQTTSFCSWLKQLVKLHNILYNSSSLVFSKIVNNLIVGHKNHRNKQFFQYLRA